METLTLVIKNKSKKPALLNFLKSIDYIDVQDSAQKNKKEIYTSDQLKLKKELERAFKNLKLAEAGKIKMLTAKDLLNEMKKW